MPKKRKSRKPRKRWKNRRFAAACGFLLALLVLGAAAALFTAPDVTGLRKKNPRETAMMRYRESRAKAKGQSIGRFQIWVPLSRMSPYLIQAVMISEDDKFFMHEGFDWEGMRDALEKNLKSGHIVGGGSTITQQLAKNLYLKPTRNPIRKIREAAIAFWLDKKLKKARILELYLNVIEWGRGIYGAEAAARTYYGRTASELSPAEAVRLATILPSPLRLNPDGNDWRWLKEKRRNIAQTMLKRHSISEEQYRDLVADVDPGAAWLSSVPDSTAAADSLGSDTVAVILEVQSPSERGPAPPDSIAPPRD
jgi:monofunctional glycosyltransferase